MHTRVSGAQWSVAAQSFDSTIAETPSSVHGAPASFCGAHWPDRQPIGPASGSPAGKPPAMQLQYSVPLHIAFSTQPVMHVLSLPQTKGGVHWVRVVPSQCSPSPGHTGHPVPGSS